MEYSKQLSDHKTQYPDLVQDAIALIEAQYAYLYGIDELADLLEVTKHHLIRTFTASTGISPGKYLAEIRIRQAKRMLLSGENAPMEIIAGACGYSCGNYFSKVFKRHTGVTPSEFIESAQENLVQENEIFPSGEDIMKQFYL